MASYNKVILAGNLTRDPELKKLNSGTSVCKFSMAVNRRYKTQSGENREDVLFIEIDSMGKQAETIAKYCSKGSPLLIEGRLKLDQWEDLETGDKRSRHGVFLESFTFLGGKGDGEGSGRKEGSSGGYTPRASSAPRQQSMNGFSGNGPSYATEEDVPF